MPDWIGGLAVEVTNEKTGSSTFDPPECSVLQHAQDALGTPKAAVETTFIIGADGRMLEEKIASWSVQQTALAQKLADSASRCATYKVIAKDGTETTFVAKQLPIPGVTGGLAVRLDAATATGSFLEYVVHVVRGNTVLRLLAFDDQLTDDELTQLAAKSVVKLEAAGG